MAPEVLLLILKAHEKLADVIHLCSTCHFFKELWLVNARSIVQEIVPKEIIRFEGTSSGCLNASSVSDLGSMKLRISVPRSCMSVSNFSASLVTMHVLG